MIGRVFEHALFSRLKVQMHKDLKIGQRLWNWQQYAPWHYTWSLFKPKTPTVMKILVSIQPSIEEEEITLITDHAALEWAWVYEKVSQQLVAWGATFTVYPGLEILHQDNWKIWNHSIINPLLQSIQIPPQDSPSNNDGIPTRQDAIRHDVAQRAENKMSRLTTTSKTTYHARWWEDIICRQAFDASTRQQLAAEVKHKDSLYMVKVVEDEYSNSSRIKGFVYSESQGDALLPPKTDHWTYPFGIKSSVIPLNEDWVKQLQPLIAVDLIMCKKFAKIYEMDKFLASHYLEVQFIEKMIIFASHFQGRCDRLPVLHHINARWKTQLCTLRSKVNTVLCWIYKPKSTHTEPCHYSIAWLQQLSFCSTMNKDIKAHSFTYNTSGYWKIKFNNQTRMSTLLRPTQLPSHSPPSHWIWWQVDQTPENVIAQLCWW